MCWRRCKVTELSYIASGPLLVVQPLWKIVWTFVIKLNIYPPHDLAMPILDIVTCINNSFPLNKWIWYIHTMNYYTAEEMKELLIHAMTWMNSNHIQSERSQSQEIIYWIISIIWHPQQYKSVLMKKRSVVARGQGMAVATKNAREVLRGYNWSLFWLWWSLHESTRVEY